MVQIENVEPKKRGPKPKMLVDAPVKVEDKIIVPAPERKEDAPAVAIPTKPVIDSLDDLRAALDLLSTGRGTYEINMNDNTITFKGGPLIETCTTLHQPSKRIIAEAERHFKGTFVYHQKETLSKDDVDSLVEKRLMDKLKELGLA